MESTAHQRSYSPPQWIDVADIVFSCLFVGEVLLRILGQERRFFLGKHWNWNTLDFFVEMLGFADLVLMTASSSNQDIFRSLRLLKVLEGRSFQKQRLSDLKKTLLKLSCLAVIV